MEDMIKGFPLCDLREPLKYAALYGGIGGMQNDIHRKSGNREDIRHSIHRDGMQCLIESISGFDAVRVGDQIKTVIG